MMTLPARGNRHLSGRSASALRRRHARSTQRSGTPGRRVELGLSVPSPQRHGDATGSSLRRVLRASGCYGPTSAFTSLARL